MSQIVLLVLVACSAPSSPPDADAGGPNVLIVLVDALRPERLGVYGNGRGLTPFLDGFGRLSLVFDRAYSTTSWTVPAVASLFTSRHASQHLVLARESRVLDSEVTLAELVRNRGYRTAGFTANIHLDQRHGYAQGFTGRFSRRLPPRRRGP